MAGLGGIDQAVRGGHRLVLGTRDLQRDDQGCPGECLSVATARELGAAPLNTPFELANMYAPPTQHSMPWGTSSRPLARTVWAASL